jgi:carboxymethylenebutenolidase
MIGLSYDAVLSESVAINGAGGDQIEAYLARPLSSGPRGGVVVIHHMPGYDAATKEMTRRFAVLGYNAICPNLYTREAPGASPDDAAAAARASGGVPDDRLVGDVAGAAAALRALSTANGKVGVIGHCSGGRQAFLAAVSLDVDAAVDCYGAAVVEGAPGRESLIGRAGDLGCPLLGLFGREDSHPAPAETAVLEQRLSELGKTFEFHTFDGAGHAFFAVNRPSYRVEAANEGWDLITAFYGRYLKG